MCGIAGIINLDGRQASEDLLGSMLGLMKHRGPNDQGIFIDGSIGMGQVRLSILDLSERGHQPMFSNSSRYGLIYNGEIYNYVELRSELSAGYEFKTKTDSEVILAAYEKWGEKCVEKFNGMWCFAIYDKYQKSLFISRDRYGVKPLFYYQTPETFIFASEIKVLHSILKKSLSINKKTIFEYLIYNRTDQSCETFVKEIQRVQHGTNITITGSSVREYRWYDLKQRVHDPFKSAEEYKEVFTSAVNLRLRSDVPLGVCLSGGLDSSAVTSVILKKFGRHDLHAFSAVYGENQRGDESRFISEFASMPNLHYIYPTSETFQSDFNAFMNCHFEPVHTMSIYSQFKVMKEASKFVTVALDGQGADEQLAGYHYFFGSYFRELISQFKWGKLFSESLAYYRHHRSAEAFKYLAFYTMPNSMKDYIGSKRVSGISPDFFSDQTKDSKLASQLYNPRSLNDSLLQHFEYKLEHNLKWNDLNSMFFSVELREPFLDFRLVERTLATPPDQKISKGYTKDILRKAMKGLLPETIRLRMDKVGFDNPSDEWMRSQGMQDKVYEALNSAELKFSGFFDVDACHNRYKRHLRGEISISKEIWKWIHMHHFLKEF